MAANIDYDIDKLIIYVTTPPTSGRLELDVQVDIYSDIKEDWKTNPTLNKLKFPLLPVGGNVTNPPDKISPFYFLKYGWRMRPYEADHTLYLTKGYLLVEGGGDPWLKTLGNYAVNIRDTVPADAFSVIAGSGLIPTEQAKLDEIHRILGLKVGEPLFVDDEAGEITVGDILIKMIGDGIKQKTLERQP